MIKRFSESVGASASRLIEDEMPLWLRQSIFLRVVCPFVLIELEVNPADIEIETVIKKPIYCFNLIQEIALMTQSHIPQQASFPSQSLEALWQMTVSLEWSKFYDVLNHIAAQLLDAERRTSFNQYSKFRERLNECLDLGNVAWRLSHDNEFFRVRPHFVTALEVDVSKEKGAFSRHLEKARSFLNGRPPDSANAIKESVSAVESVARTYYPGCSTLGDVLKQIRKNQRVPAQIATLVEKLYAFASSEPGVRHGSPEQERVDSNDAEFVYAVSMAVIRYLQGKA